MHPGLGGRSICLPGVTGDAGADNVFPCRRPTAVTRDHMIEVEVAAVEAAATILAGVTVALEDIVTSKLNFFLW